MIFDLGLNNIALLLLRLAIASIFLQSGMMQLKNIKGSAKSMNLPVWFIAILGAGEFLGGIAMMFGFLTEIAAIGYLLIIFGIFYFKIVKWKVPFMGERGWKTEITYLAIVLAVLSMGAGTISLDAMFGFFP